jgi:hypothetical protein
MHPESVLMTVDGQAVPVTVSENNGTYSFTSQYITYLANCPQGRQKGSFTVKGQFHDQGHPDTWVTGFTVTINYTYKCKCSCRGDFDEPFKTTFSWSGSDEP